MELILDFISTVFIDQPDKYYKTDLVKAIQSADYWSKLDDDEKFLLNVDVIHHIDLKVLKEIISDLYQHYLTLFPYSNYDHFYKLYIVDAIKDLRHLIDVFNSEGEYYDVVHNGKKGILGRIMIGESSDMYVKYLYCENVTEGYAGHFYYTYVLAVIKMLQDFASNPFESSDKDSNFFKQEIKQIKEEPKEIQWKKYEKKIEWKASKTEFVELVRALIASEAIPSDNIGEIFKILSSVFNVKFEGKDPYNFYQDIKKRSNGSETLFIDKLKESLLKELNEK